MPLAPLRDRIDAGAAWLDGIIPGWNDETGPEQEALPPDEYLEWLSPPDAFPFPIPDLVSIGFKPGEGETAADLGRAWLALVVSRRTP